MVISIEIGAFSTSTFTVPRTSRAVCVLSLSSGIDTWSLLAIQYLKKLYYYVISGSKMRVHVNCLNVIR